MRPPDLAIGQSVWVQGRPHPTLPNHYDCYGVISDLNYDLMFEEVENVTVLFTDSGTSVNIPSEDFYSWNEKNNSWSVYLEDFT